MKVDDSTYHVIRNFLLWGCFVFTLFVLLVSEFVTTLDIGFLVIEDGIVESLTVIFLVAAAIISLLRFQGLRGNSRYVYLIAGCFIVFVAGEELSWGQRIFDIRTPEFFYVHNAQRETNLHNMVIYGHKLNRILFGNLLEFVAMATLLLLHYLNTRSSKSRDVCVKYAILFPDFVLIMMYVLSTMLVYLMELPRKWEVMELIQALTLFLLLLKPLATCKQRTQAL